MLWFRAGREIIREEQSLNGVFVEQLDNMRRGRETKVLRIREMIGEDFTYVRPKKKEVEESLRRILVKE